ncbi:MAG: hypothetical protein AUJ43_02510 [Parcubacteria group bacterium CG1_02_44_31]|nr:MAG: hypothetical protein AUJ43_02510 [Parcubacteria group bacterium CG1_02_44_31]
MKLPFVVLDNLPEYYYKKWEKQMTPINGRRDRTINWMLWYKMQNKGFSSQPPWSSILDQRRRLIQFIDQYDVQKNEKGSYRFVVTKPYFWINYLHPSSEIDFYFQNVLRALHDSKWKENGRDPNRLSFSRGDLYFSGEIMDKHPIDVADGRDYPVGHKVFEAIISSRGLALTDEQRNTPWNAVRAAFRVPDSRGNPSIVSNVSLLKRYFPMQVQLGAGSSIDCGILPLHAFHDLYTISNRATGNTLFDVQVDDALIYYLRDPESFWKRVSEPYVHVLKAEPNIFHYMLKALYDKGNIVGPIITNDYDGLPFLLGMDELFVRKLAASRRCEIQGFDPRARSLLVVGEHADRRRIQHAARERGLQVIYVDPEGYQTQDGFERYPLESPQDKDILFRMSAKSFGEAINKVFFNDSIVVPLRSF